MYHIHSTNDYKCVVVLILLLVWWVCTLAVRHYSSVLTTVYPPSCWVILLNTRYIYQNIILTLHAVWLYARHQFPLYSAQCADVWEYREYRESWTGSTYPSTGDDIWSLDAQLSQLLPPRLSCYRGQADLTPWLDNSPFFPIKLYLYNSLCKTWTQRSAFQRAIGPSLRLTQLEELDQASLSFFLGGG